MDIDASAAGLEGASSAGPKVIDVGASATGLEGASAAGPESIDNGASADVLPEADDETVFKDFAFLRANAKPDLSNKENPDATKSTEKEDEGEEEEDIDGAKSNATLDLSKKENSNATLSTSEEEEEEEGEEEEEEEEEEDSDEYDEDESDDELEFRYFAGTSSQREKMWKQIVKHEIEVSQQVVYHRRCLHKQALLLPEIGEFALDPLWIKVTHATANPEEFPHRPSSLPTHTPAHDGFPM
jgi:hypothetical protein